MQTAEANKTEKYKAEVEAEAQTAAATTAVTAKATRTTKSNCTIKGNEFELKI